MSITGMSPDVADRFDRLCKAISLRGEGMTLSQLGTAHALARAMVADDPDTERVEMLARRLDLDPEDLGESVSQ